jgi:hypothetical protein
MTRKAPTPVAGQHNHRADGPPNRVGGLTKMPASVSVLHARATQQAYPSPSGVFSNGATYRPVWRQHALPNETHL